MRVRIVTVASIVAVALAVALPYAAQAAQPAQPAAPASTPAVCPASSPATSAVTQLPVAASPVPATTPICFVYGACVKCTHTTAQPCVITQCGTRKTYHCDACTTDCVPPSL